MVVDTKVRLRAPNAANIASPPVVLPPPLEWLNGTWNLTYSTLPRWHKSRNVTVSYTLLPKDPKTITPLEFLAVQWGTQLEESVFWQPLNSYSASFRTTKRLWIPCGVAGESNGEMVPDLYGDTYHHGERASLVYARHDRGWSRLVSSKQEILGYGIDTPTRWKHEHVSFAKGNSWIVIYFTKTLFSPPELDILCRHGQLPSETVDAMKSTLAGLGGYMAEMMPNLTRITTDVKVNETQYSPNT